jgi:hypothetical protein
MGKLFFNFITNDCKVYSTFLLLTFDQLHKYIMQLLH